MRRLIRDLAQKVMLLRGWQRIAVAFGAGALAATAMQPLLFWPVLLLSFPVLVWLVDGIFSARPSRRLAVLKAFAIGWVFGFGYFLASLYWIGAAFLVEAETYAWMMPIAVAALPAGMALYWGAATAVAAIGWASGPCRILLLVTLLSLAEWLRGHLFTGFPWNAIGYAAEAFDAFGQIAAYVGIWGLTFFVVLLAMLPAFWAEAEPSRLGRRLVSGLVLGAVALWLAGSIRLENAASSAAEGISLRIVQPNIPQSEKWRSENAAAIIDDLIALSTEAQAAGAKAPTHIVWPESAVPLYIDSAPHALAVIADDLPDSSTLIMGSLRRKADGEVYNSLFALDGLGRSLAVYDKWHLVPYGEYLPFAELLEPLGLRRVVTVPGSFAAGEGIRTIAVPGTPPFSPLICYEAIFPGSVASPRNRPEWLLNVTNDGWFGSTSGPYQHLAQARFRAIEEGLPVVRAANTGISAVIDAHGRVVKRLPLNLKGRIDAVLPAAIAPTFYARYGDLAFFLMLTLCGATAIAGQRRLATAAANPGQKPVNQN